MAKIGNLDNYDIDCLIFTLYGQISVLDNFEILNHSFSNRNPAGMKLPDHQQIEEIVEWHLTQIEQLGDQVGGSGHLANRSLNNLKVKSGNKTIDGIWVEFEYQIVIESEFTIYPDNPPYTEDKSGKLFVDEVLVTNFEEYQRQKSDKKKLDDQRFLDSLS